MVDKQQTAVRDLPRECHPCAVPQRRASPIQERDGEAGTARRANAQPSDGWPNVLRRRVSAQEAEEWFYGDPADE